MANTPQLGHPGPLVQRAIYVCRRGKLGLGFHCRTRPEPQQGLPGLLLVSLEPGGRHAMLFSPGELSQTLSAFALGAA